jgi:hypothetical protein
MSYKLTAEADELVASFSTLKAMQTATTQQRSNIDNWFASYGEDAIDPEEQHHRGHRGDLLAMFTEYQYPLLAFLSRSRIIRRMFMLKARNDRVASELTTYVSTRGLKVFATLVALGTGLSMSFASNWGLNFIDNKVYRLGFITASGALMAIFAWVAAGNRPFEIFTTCAAYMAMLMIYQQTSS